MPTFEGYGPLPGIESATWREAAEQAPRLGAVRDVLSRDGTRHVEEIVEFEVEARIADRIHGFRGPPSLFLKQMRDAWQFEAVSRGTRVVRTMHIELRSAWWLPIGLLLRFLMRRAFRRHHRRLGAVLRPSR